MATVPSNRLSGNTLGDPWSAALRPEQLDWRLPAPPPTVERSGLVVTRGNPTRPLKSVRVTHRASPFLTGILPTRQSRLQIGQRGVWLL